MRAYLMEVADSFPSGVGMQESSSVSDRGST